MAADDAGMAAQAAFLTYTFGADREADLLRQAFAKELAETRQGLEAPRPAPQVGRTAPPDVRALAERIVVHDAYGKRVTDHPYTAGHEDIVALARAVLATPPDRIAELEATVQELKDIRAGLERQLRNQARLHAEREHPIVDETATPPTPPDLVALEAKARAADEGFPWKPRIGSDESCVVLADGVAFGYCVVAEVAGTQSDGENHEAIARYIAAAHPQAVLALIARVKGLETAMYRYARHEPGCGSYTGRADTDCTCGLNAPLASAEEEGR